MFRTLSRRAVLLLGGAILLAPARDVVLLDLRLVWSPAWTESYETDRSHIDFLAVQHCSAVCPGAAGQAPSHRLAQSLYDAVVSATGPWESRVAAITRLVSEVWTH